MEIKEELEDDTHPISKKRIAHTRKTPPIVKATEKKAQDSDGDVELWRRLDELEHQEEEKSQQEVGGYEQDEETNGAAGITIDHKGAGINVINISHTSLLMPHITSDTTHTPSGTINSPADICVKKSSVDSAVHVNEPMVKSKSVHWSSDVTSPPQPSPENLTEMPAAPKPFTGSVVEKSTPATASTVSDHIPLNLVISLP